MPYKLLIFAPSAGGKSTLMRYLRVNTDLVIAETDEEVMKANNDVWPDDELKNKVLIPQTTKAILNRNSVVYFASYIHDNLIKEAREKGFTIILMSLTMQQLLARNKKRMETENYQDVSPWLQGQLDNYTKLQKAGLIDQIIDGNRPVERLAQTTIDITR